MSGKVDGEHILLDAEIRDVIGTYVYRAALENGHVVTAFVACKDRQGARNPAVGDRIRLRMSPYDMCKGAVIFDSVRGEK